MLTEKLGVPKLMLIYPLEASLYIMKGTTLSGWGPELLPKTQGLLNLIPAFVCFTY